ncbi:ECF transporter S component [Paenibacillus pinihumi]|uniref:ECF transporter S component n=1 Tax=Paenibacillus pinihumi TaxID=669462 RepID=UPI0003F59AA7|nr:ECF transporter S component [Paenibacillus pinihumi]
MQQTQMMNAGLKNKGISARHIVATVISALIFGATIYISRFVPIKLGTIQVLYPAAIFAPLFGIWFGIWGSAGLVLGNILSMVVVGMNPAIFPFALLAQFIMGFVPGIAYRKIGFDSAKDKVRFVAAVVAGMVAATALVALNLVLIQKMPANVVWGTIWLWMQVSNTLTAAVFSPLLFAWMSDYMNKSGLFFKRFLG